MINLSKYLSKQKSLQEIIFSLVFIQSFISVFELAQCLDSFKDYLIFEKFKIA